MPLMNVLNERSWLVGVLGTVLALLTSSLSVSTLNEGREQALAHARETASNLALVIRSDIEHNIELYGLSLQAIVDGAQDSSIMRLPDTFKRKMLFDRATTAFFLGGAFLMNAKGEIVVESGQVVPQDGNFNTRDYFSVQKRNPNAGLFFSKPYKERLRQNRYSIAMSKRVNNEDGSFAGIGVIVIRIEYFDELLRKISTGKSGVAFIVQRDGGLIAQKPYSDDSVGKNLAASPDFGTLTASESGTFTTTSLMPDGVPRIYSFSNIPHTPWIVAVAPAEEDALADWRAQKSIVSTLTAIIALAFTAISWFLTFALKDRAKAYAEVVELASSDPLTGLNNRRTLDAGIDKEWRRAVRENLPTSFLFIDIDNFKLYNDTYGHALGDITLTRVAQCMDKVIRRPGDMGARYGGEEFVILLSNTEPPGAATIAERLRASVEQLKIPHSGSAKGVVTVSIGHATHYPRRGGQWLDLIKEADKLLYEAKEHGRNRIYPPLLETDKV